MGLTDPGHGRTSTRRRAGCGRDRPADERRRWLLTDPARAGQGHGLGTRGQLPDGLGGLLPRGTPVHRVAVDGFWMDAHPVTNAEFRRFVKATGHLTVAERPPEAADYPDADPDLLVPGALVFRPTSGPVDLRDWRTWWAWVPGADWRHPEGPGSTLHGRERHPVVQVAYADALAYAAWAGKTLASEAEWGFAARGGLEGKVFCWGDEFAPKGRQMANTWQGEFPWQNLLTDRYAGTSPVGRSRPTAGRPAILCATGRRPGKVRRSTPPLATSAFAASCVPPRARLHERGAHQPGAWDGRWWAGRH